MSVSQRLNRIIEGFNFKVNEKETTFKVDYREKCYFFPFSSRKPEKPNIKKTFDGITGVYSRMASGSNAKNPDDLFNLMDKAFENSPEITIDKEYKDEVKDQLVNYLKKENGNINVLSPSLFKALKLQKTENKNDKFEKGERDYGCFLFDVFGSGEIQDLFNNEETNRLLDFIDTLIEYDKKEDNSRAKSKCKLPTIKNLFIEDLKFLRSNVDIFLDKLPLLLHYYLLFYCSQLAIKLNLQFNVSNERMQAIEKIYYLLDDERLSAQRLAIDSGYNTITNASKNLFENLIVLSSLNYIFDEGDLEFKLNTYCELKELYESMDNETKTEILNTLQEWIFLLKKVIVNFNYNPSDLSNFNLACNAIYNCFQDQKYAAQSSRYSLNMPDLLYCFSKSHGKQGISMSLTQDNLLFFIRLATKGKRIKIKEVFNELERRGIFFDSTTQKLIIQKLDKLNMLDSVSDSGDAKYVKEI